MESQSCFLWDTGGARIKALQSNPLAPLKHGPGATPATSLIEGSAIGGEASAHHNGVSASHAAMLKVFCSDGRIMNQSKICMLVLAHIEPLPTSAVSVQSQS